MSTFVGVVEQVKRYSIASDTHGTVLNQFGSLRRGKDGRMYVVSSGETELQVVEHPDGTPHISSVNATSGSWTLVGDMALQPHRICSANDEIYTRKLGNKQYELTDHLGNVRATVSDIKLTGDSGFVADVTSANDYFGFGMEMPGRSFNATSIRYGFNGKEVDDEIKGAGNSYDFGDRIYDPRICRPLSVDPFSVNFPNQSTYLFADNNPILNIDKDGGYAITVHYLITQQQLIKFGITNADQVELLSHYASVFADHPPVKVVTLNNILFPFDMVFYRDDIDYSLTKNSQRTDLIENSIWHAMKSDQEEADNSISDYSAQLRGMEFGWDKIFESAKEGKLESLEKNSKGIEAFGQGIHALQDSEPHKGVGFERHDHLGDLSSGIRAHALTGSAILVHQIMNGITDNLEDAQLYLRGMSSDNMNILNNKLTALGYSMDYKRGFDSDDSFYLYTVKKNDE